MTPLKYTLQTGDYITFAGGCSGIFKREKPFRNSHISFGQGSMNINAYDNNLGCLLPFEDLEIVSIKRIVDKK